MINATAMINDKCYCYDYEMGYAITDFAFWLSFFFILNFCPRLQ
jgi:hypothetical protein